MRIFTQEEQHLKHTVLFLHLLGLSVWMGCFVAVIFCLIGLKNASISEDMRQTLNRIQLRMVAIGNVGALLMLISGFVLFTIEHHHAVWVDLMAGLGGGTCVFSLLGVTIQSNLLAGRIRKNANDNILTGQLGLLTVSSWIVAFGIVLVLAIVSYRV